MKKVFTTLFMTFLGLALMAQTLPQGINYQAVARDLQGNVLANQDISLLIELVLDGDPEEKTYIETHRVITNELGLFSIVVGEGRTKSGVFTEVPWAEHEIWMQIGLDEKGDGTFNIVNSSRLLAVPYALHAGSAEKLSKPEESERNGGIYWHILGNSGTVPGITFIGTTDFKDFVMKTNNIEALRISATQEIEISSDLSVGNNALIGNDLNVTNDAAIGNDLDVDGIARFNNTTESTTKDDGSVIVEGGVGIEKNTNIGGNGDIEGTLNVGGVTTVENTTESTSKDNGALIVEGGTGVEKNLNVGGITTVENTTESTSKDDGALVVEGGTGIEKNLNVGGITTVENTTESTSKDDGALVVEGGAGIEKNLNVGGDTKLSGRFTVDTTVDGDQTEQTSYPVLITGSKQGLAIDLTPATTNVLKSGRGNNYISFWEDGAQTGRIEGMNLADLDPTGLVSIISGFVSSPPNLLDISYTFGSFSLPQPTVDASLNIDFINDDFDFDIDVGLDGGSFSNPFNDLDDTYSGILGSPNGPSGSGPAATIWNDVISPAINNDNLFPDGETQTNFNSQIFSNYTLDVLNGSISTLGAIVTFATSLASILDPEDIFSEGVGLVVEILNLIIYGSYADINLGVAYESGSGDYAEWLERADIDETISPGDVVGVIGGKISKKFTHADRFMAVSTSPIVLGNMPKDANGESRAEKVAFMGQIPVKVRGLVEIGDYILPSGEGDGTAIAVSPQHMLARDYQRIIGVAWDQSEPENFINMINTAVGLNHNDMSKVIEEMQFTMNQMQLAIKEVNPDFEMRFYNTEYAEHPQKGLDYSVASSHTSNISGYFEGKTYANRGEMLQDVKKAMMEEAGINFDNIPLVEYMLDHPEQAEELAAYYQDLLGDMMWITAQVNNASKK